VQHWIEGLFILLPWLLPMQENYQTSIRPRWLRTSYL